jgi:predicted phage-related endonuclease
MKVFVEKRGIVLPEKGDEATKAWGHTLEPVIANWYELNQGVELLPCGTMQSESHPLIFCTADYKIVGRSRALEIKNVGSFMKWHWDDGDADGIPDYVRAQVSIQAYIGGYEDGHVCASLAGAAPRIWQVQADRELAERLIDMGEKFWRDNVERDEPPTDQRDGDAFRAWLSARYPQPPERVVVEEIPDDVRAMALARIEHASLKAKHEKSKKEIDAILMSRLGLLDADSFKANGWTFSWRRQKNTGDRRMPRFTVKPAKGEARAPDDE